MKKKVFLSAALIAALLLSRPVDLPAIEIEGLSIHGFASQGYLKSTDNNYLAETKDGTFEYNETAINFSLCPIDYLRLGVQFMSRDMGPTTNNDVYMDWGYADYRFINALGARVGKIKAPMGFYNQTRDVDFLRTFILLPQGFYSEIERGQAEATQGGSIYGNFGIGALGDLEYEIAGGTSNPSLDSPNYINFAAQLDQSLSGAKVTGTYQNVKWSTASTLRWNTPVEGLRLGFSLNTSETEMGRNYLIGSTPIRIKTEISVTAPMFSIEYLRNNLRLAAEYRQINGDVDTSANGRSMNKMDVKREAYYGSAAFQVLDWLELGTYYSIFYPDRDDKDGSDLEAEGTPDYFALQKDWAVTVKFNLNESVTLKLETHFIDGAAQIYEHDNPDGIEDNMVLYAAKCSFKF